jgi:hypothetical protein
MDKTSKVKFNIMYKTMQARVLELEGALKDLIEDHKHFQIEQDLEHYESILNKKLTENVSEFEDESHDYALVG